jgi:hypothetical protein
MTKTNLVVDPYLAREFNKLADELETNGVEHTICSNLRYIAKHGHTFFDGYAKFNDSTSRIIQDNFPESIKGETIDGRFGHTVDIRTPKISALRKFKSLLSIGAKISLSYGTYKELETREVYYVVRTVSTGVIVNRNPDEVYGIYIMFPKLSDLSYYEEDYTHLFTFYKKGMTDFQLEILK